MAAWRALALLMSLLIAGGVQAKDYLGFNFERDTRADAQRKIERLGIDVAWQGDVLQVHRTYLFDFWTRLDHGHLSFSRANRIAGLRLHLLFEDKDDLNDFLRRLNEEYELALHCERPAECSLQAQDERDMRFDVQTGTQPKNDKDFRFWMQLAIRPAAS